MKKKTPKHQGATSKAGRNAKRQESGVEGVSSSDTQPEGSPVEPGLAVEDPKNEGGALPATASPPIGENVRPPRPESGTGDTNSQDIAQGAVQATKPEEIVVGLRADGKDIRFRKGLRKEEIASMKEAGISEEQIEERNADRLSRGGLYSRRPQLSDLIVKYATLMIASYGGRYLFSARGAGSWLIDEGHHRDVDSYVGFGTSMGLGRLELPVIWVHCDGPRMVRFHDLSYIGRSLRDKAARAEELRTFGPEVIRDLIAA
jgi:hypothetical protein